MYFRGEKANIFYMHIIPHAPINSLYVTIEKKFQETITFDSGVTLYKDTSFHPEESVMLKAKVVSVPRAIQQRYDYRGFDTDIPYVGATILMRYDVIFRYKEQPDRSTPIYKNLVFYGGQEYWRVDIQQALGIFIGGKLYGLNHYIICEPVGAETNNLIIPAKRITMDHFTDHAALKDKPTIGRYRAITDQPNYGIEAGEEFEVTPGIAQNYEIDTFKFSVINCQRILAL
jgi:hypothetical protein